MTEVENVDTKTKMTEMESCDVENTITEIKSSDIKESLADVVSLDGNTTVTEMESTDTKPKATESESSGPKAKVQRCETCNTFCVGEEAFEKHLQSQKHKDKVEGKTTGAGDANKKDSAVNKKDEEKSKSHSRQARKDDSSDSKKKDSQSKSSDKDRDRRVSSRDKGRYGRHDVRRRSAELSRDRSGRRSYHSRSPHHTRDRSRDRKSRTAHSKKKGHSSDNESEGEVMYLSGSDWEIMDETNDDDENQPIEDGKENTKETKSDPTLKSATDKNNEGKTEKETKESFEKVSNHSKTKLDKPETKDKPATKNQSTAKDKSNTTVEKNEKSKNAETEIKNKNTKETTGTENLKDAKDFFCEVCKVHVFNQQNFDKHCTGNKHKTNLMASVNKAAQIAKLQAHVDRCTEPLLGMSLVLEIPRALGEPYYKCLLCDSNCIGKSIISHIKGYKHCVTYLQKFHPAIAAKIPQNKKGGRSGLDAFIQKLGEANRKEKIIVAKESDAVDVARKICESRGLELILNQEGKKETSVDEPLKEVQKKKIPTIVNQPSSAKNRNIAPSNDKKIHRKLPDKNSNTSRHGYNSDAGIFPPVVPFQMQQSYQAHPGSFNQNPMPPKGQTAAVNKLSQLDAYFGFPDSSGTMTKSSPIRESFNRQNTRPLEQDRFDYDIKVRLDRQDHYPRRDSMELRTERSPKRDRFKPERNHSPPREFLSRRISVSPVRETFINRNHSYPHDRFPSDEHRTFRDDFGHHLSMSPGRDDLGRCIERSPQRESSYVGRPLQDEPLHRMDQSPSRNFVHLDRSPPRDDFRRHMDGSPSRNNYSYRRDRSPQYDDFGVHHRNISPRPDVFNIHRDRSPRLDEFVHRNDGSSKRDDFTIRRDLSPLVDDLVHHRDRPLHRDRSPRRDDFPHPRDGSPRRDDFNHRRDVSPHQDGLGHRGDRPQRDDLIHQGNRISHWDDFKQHLVVTPSRDISSSSHKENFTYINKTSKVEEKGPREIYGKHTNAPLPKDNFDRHIDRSIMKENFDRQKSSVKEEAKKRQSDRFSNQEEVKKGKLNPNIDYYGVNSAKTTLLQTADSIVEQSSTNPPAGIMTQNKANYLAAAMLLAQTLLQQRSGSSVKEVSEMGKPITSASVVTDYGQSQMNIKKDQVKSDVKKATFGETKQNPFVAQSMQNNPLASNIPIISPLEQFNAMASNIQQQLGFKNLNSSTQQLLTAGINFGNQRMGIENQVSSSVSGNSAGMALTNRLNMDNQQIPGLGNYDSGHARQVNQTPGLSAIQPNPLQINQSVRLNTNSLSRFGTNQSGFPVNQATGFNSNQGIGFNTGMGFNSNSQMGFGTNQGSGFNTNQSSGFNSNQGSGFNSNQGSGFNSNQSFGFNRNQSSGFNTNQATGFNTSQSTGFNSNLSLFKSNQASGFQSNHPTGINKPFGMFEHNRGFGQSQQNSSFGSANVSIPSLLSLNPIRGFQSSESEKLSEFGMPNKRNRKRKRF